MRWFWTDQGHKFSFFSPNIGKFQIYTYIVLYIYRTIKWSPVYTSWFGFCLWLFLVCLFKTFKVVFIYSKNYTFQSVVLTNVYPHVATTTTRLENNFHMPPCPFNPPLPHLSPVFCPYHFAFPSMSYKLYYTARGLLCLLPLVGVMPLQLAQGAVHVSTLFHGMVHQPMFWVPSACHMGDGPWRGKMRGRGPLC